MGRAALATESKVFGIDQKRVLCATDLSPRSERAVGAAAKLATRLSAQLILLHVVERGRDVNACLYTQERLSEQLAGSALRIGAVPALAVRSGKPVTAIADVASEMGAGLIVLGPQRRRPLAPLLGTTAERVVGQAGLPALVVNTQAALRYDGIVIAAEVDAGHIDLVRMASQYGFIDGMPLTLVHAFDWPYQGPLYAEGFDIAAAKRNVERWKHHAVEHFRHGLQAAGVPEGHCDIVVEEGEPLGVLARALQRYRFPLLVIGSSAHTALSRLIEGSVANDALRDLHCDMLVGSGGNGRFQTH